jgi:hypothetical protein
MWDTSSLFTPTSLGPPTQQTKPVRNGKQTWAVEDPIASSPLVDDVHAVRRSKIKSLNLGAMLRSIIRAA